MNSRIRLLTVDAAGTLIRPWPSVGAVYAKTARRHDLSVEDEVIDRRFYEALGQTQKDLKISLGDEKNFWREVVRRTFHPYGEKERLDPIFEELWELFAHGDHWKLAERAHITLKTLHARGYEIALLSNNDSRLRQVVRELGITDLFSQIFISAEIGHEKPSPEIFRFVERKMQRMPHEILHLGDSFARDFQGALRAGWSALLFGRPKIEEKQIFCFSELLDLLP